jgi:hypothetical protein
MVEPDRPQIKIRRMRLACWIPKAPNTHSEHVILTASQLQQFLHERPQYCVSTYIYVLLIVIVTFATLGKRRLGFHEIVRLDE